MSAYSPPLDGRDPKTHELLDFNERTRPVSENVQNALVDYICSGRLQMYPSYSDITKHIADYSDVDDDQVMITNGSDQGIDLIFRSACEPGDEVIIPEPSFAMYFQCASVENVKVIKPYYLKGEGYPLKEVLKAISEKTKVIVVSNPNNPCGTLATKEQIKVLAEAAPHAVILVDECYFEYAKVSVVDLVSEFTNIIVTRTFSKTWGLPSLRFGYVVSAKENINVLLNVRGPYDVNQLAVVAVRAALLNFEDVQSYINEVMNISKPLFENFLLDQKIDFWPSEANFLWVFLNDALEFEKRLRKSGVLVRPKKDVGGKTGLRITLGSKEQTKKIIEIIKLIQKDISEN